MLGKKSYIDERNKKIAFIKSEENLCLDNKGTAESQKWKAIHTNNQIVFFYIQNVFHSTNTNSKKFKRATMKGWGKPRQNIISIFILKRTKSEFDK